MTKSAGLPLVSIVCITYNQANYIEDALTGFISQDLDGVFEIIIHDDASTDGTVDILKSFQQRNKENVKLILRDVNQYSTRGFSFFNDILRVARGQYIAVCEGDDYWIDPTKLKRQVQILDSRPDVSLSIHNARRMDCGSGISLKFNSKGLPLTLGVRDVILRRWFSPTASFLFRRGIVTIPDGALANGDMLILFQCAAKGKIHYLDRVMSVYRYASKGSLSSAVAEDRWALCFKKLEFYRYIDTVSRRRLFVYTSIAKLKVYASYMIFCVSRWMKT